MRHIPFATIVAAALIPAAALALAGGWVAVLLCLVAGTAWLGGLLRGIAWPATIGFLALVGLSGYAALGVAGPGWGLAGVVATLGAWDLTGFALRARAAGRVVDEAGLRRAHLRRLAAILGAGLALGAVTLLVRVELGFGLALLLGLVAVVALSRAVGALRESG